MSDYGFRTRNDSGGTQIDSDYKNLALRAKGTSTTGNYSGMSYSAIISVVATPTAQIAFRSQSIPISFLRAEYSNGVKTFRFRSWNAPATFEWWLFDDPAYGISNGSSYGRRVRNAQGEITFDSRMRYMKVIGVISGAANDTGASYERTLGLASYPTVAVIQSSNAFMPDYFLGSGDDPFSWLESYTEQQCVIMNSVVILTAVYSTTRTHASGDPPPALNLNQYNFLALDVTGY